MPWQLSPVVGLFAFSGILAVVFAALVATRRDRSGGTSLAVLFLVAAVWAVGDGLQIAAVDLGGKVFWANAKYLGVVGVPAAWLLFTLEYTGREEWISRRTIALLAVEPVLVLIAVWTNPSHHLFLGTPSVDAVGGLAVLTRPAAPGFWVHAVYSYALILAGTALIVELFVVSDHLYRSQAVALLLGVLTPLAGNAVFLLGLTPPGIDVTPLAFIVSAVALSWAVYRYDLLDLVPLTRQIARNELLMSMADPVIVVDGRRCIVDLNPRAAGILDRDVRACIGEPIAELLPDLAEAFPETPKRSFPEHTRISVDRDGVTRHYEVRVSRLGPRVALGYLVVMRDVTDQVRHRQRLAVLNRVLRHDLRNAINVITALASDIEDAEGIDEAIAERAGRIRDKALTLVDLAKQARDLEQSISREDVVVRRVDFARVVEDIIAALADSHPDVEMTTDLPEEAPVYASELLDTAVSNVIENAVEHNDHESPRIDVSIRTGEGSDFIALVVADNGPGIPEDERAVLREESETPLYHSSGMGLWVANWIITESGGRITFEDNAPRGTIVRIELLAADRNVVPAIGSPGEVT